MKKLLAFLSLLLIIGSASAVAVPVTRNYLSVTDTANLIVRGTNYDPSPAEPGKYVTVWITAQNVGNKDVKNSWLVVEPTYPFSLDPGVSGAEFIKLIPAGREELVEYDLRVDTQALEGSYNLKFKLCYDEACKEEIRKSEIEISVRTGGKPKLEVGLEDSILFMPGVRGDVTINAVNRGELGIKYLIVELMDSEDFEIISPSRVYIGELDSDDFETEDFNLYIKPTTVGEIEIPVKLEYSDENEKEYSGVENVMIKVYSMEEATQMGLVTQNGSARYLVLIAIVVLGGIFWYRRRKKKNDH